MMRWLKKIIYSFYQKYNINLLQFKDLHKGQECYIIGDGISLKWFDLEVFNDKPSFILSYLFYHKKFNNIGRPIYSSIAAPFYFYPYTKSRSFGWRKNYLQSRYRKAIKQHQDVNFFINLSNIFALNGSNVHYIFKAIPNSQFSDECIENNLNPLDGSFRSAISLAIFMGFSKVFLVGCDYTHTNSRIHHWYEYGTGLLYKQEMYNKDFFDIAQKYIDITTITLEGDGLYLKAIEYEKYSKKTNCYLENTELMDLADLQILATEPDYRIFPN